MKKIISVLLILSIFLIGCAGKIEKIKEEKPSEEAPSEAEKQEEVTPAAEIPLKKSNAWIGIIIAAIIAIIGIVLYFVIKKKQ